MSLIDLASLVLAPTAVKDGKVYNAIPNDQDFTFSRGTEATRVNSAGLIEKARTNYLLQSNTFDTTWENQLGVGGSITSGQSGYDGTNNAWLIEKDNTSFRRIQQYVSTSGVFTYSVYAKEGTASIMALRVVSSSSERVEFDLSDGTISFNQNEIDAKIEAVGSDGWYRCSVTRNEAITQVQIYVEWNQTIGDKNIYIQDSQLESGLVATDVITTTTSSVTVGITDDLPRVDYSGGGCPSLLLEGSRTNLVTQSEYFDDSSWSSYVFGGASLTKTFGYTSPEGVDNAYKLDVVVGTGGVLFTHNFTATASVDHTLSVWMKGEVGGEKVQIDLKNTSSSGITGSLLTLTNEWKRYDVTLTNDTGTSRGFQFRMQQSSGISDQTIYVYGAMAESSASYESSYIPTYGTSTSRSQDSCSLTNASNLIGQSEGTLFFQLKDTNNLTAYLGVDNGSTGTRILIYGINDQKIYTQVRNSGTVIFSASSSVISGGVKVAVSFDSSGSVFYVNGVQVSTGSGTTYTNLSQVTFNHSSQIGVKIKQAILFPTRLTNDQLAELTK